MTSNRFNPRFAPLRFDPLRAFVPFTAISRTELIALANSLETIRREFLGECSHGSAHAAFADQPDHMLDDYERARRASDLGRILATGKRLRESVDRVVIVAAGAVLQAARALFEAGCHPYHNELSRGDRGGRPRIYFCGDEFDNDAMQGLLDLLPAPRRESTIDERWTILAIDPSGETPSVLAATRCLLDQFGVARDETGARSLIAITSAGSALNNAVAAAGCAEQIEWPTSIPGRFSMFTAAGLLPGSAMGLDVVALLKGAVVVNEWFAVAPPGDNCPLDLAAVAHVVAAHRHPAYVWFAAKCSALGAAAQWCEQIRTPCDPGGNRRSEEGGLQTNLIVETPRRDRLAISTQSECDPLANDGLPRAEVILPTTEEDSLGQLFQAMMLATNIESRLAEKTAGSGSRKTSDAATAGRILTNPATGE